MIPETPAELEAFLRRAIPLAAFMDLRVREAGPRGVTLVAPMAPNHNVHGTMFGGSIGSLCLLAGWSLVHRALAMARRDGPAGAPVPEIVVQRAQIEYLKPVDGELAVHAEAPSRDVWQRFLRTLERRGRARLRLTIEARQGPFPAARMDGWFAALRDGG